MKRISLTALLLCIMHYALCIETHHDWEDHHVLQINREPARAYFIPYGEKAGDRMLSLNGDWRFPPTGKSTDMAHLFIFLLVIRSR